MPSARFEQLVSELCDVLGLADKQGLLEHRTIEIEGFEVYLHLPETQPDDEVQEESLYLRMSYGLAPAGRTLVVFRLLLEANLSVYAQDQAQLGLDENGVIVLIVRVPLDADLDGAWICDLLAHYAEHGRYWNNNIFIAHDDMFEGIATGNYLWLRA
ncbi:MULTISPECIES: CesT family type III secretion system chaperone [Xanthomonas]|uniref:4-hydroxyphenylacetate 3-monooxygenase n=1 Tax=Xanthomonas cucurbitae TaxID=56453 RepID=A0A2S7DF56_9XANT|nr:CesT family type III secretion system chaperone [Xanthomonas cucurbitae]PPU72442.1 4-hydroxyphenylacetate 3-monooxygenase [Xanthomonas cucurbitae]QHG88387.1 4-hydroxyphenylacetate 3-monooxygenase [Xanthomonas cucurbitae]WDM67242.1 CesT family type III secretion system chaperone [Xanthomonas cucurbitae]WDM71120.1 CesT family type III secretion system chaperone [Xanthomonas cucurbitae]WDM74953.1 CesT family type III secretion system chaperone [Xanthomonas cucurbitae]